MSKEPRTLFLLDEWYRAAAWPKLKCKGAKAAAETRPKYINWARCGETT